MPGTGLAVTAAREIAQRRDPYEQRDHIVLLTSGSRGLGRALAEELANHGARLMICA